jgi:hypothetical protein
MTLPSLDEYIASLTNLAVAIRPAAAARPVKPGAPLSAIWYFIAWTSS